MTTPISVVIPTYNRAHLVLRAVRSVLSALEPGDELIVIDDGSTDSTPDVLAPWRDRVRYVRTPNRGVGPARNVGIAVSRHPWVAFLDSDDEWLPEKLRLQRAFLQARPDVLFCFGDFRMVDEQDRVYPRYLYQWHQVDRSWTDLLGPAAAYSASAPLPAGCTDFPVHVGNLYPAFIEGPFVAAWTALVRKDVAGDAFRFAEDLPICEEWSCFAQIARLGQAAFFDCELAVNYGHSGVRVTNTAGTHGYYTGRIRMTERIWGRDPSFLARYGERYREIIASQYLGRARWLLGQGRVEEARRDLAVLSNPPLALRFLSRLPPSLAAGLGAMRRAASARVAAR